VLCLGASTPSTKPCHDTDGRQAASVSQRVQEAAHLLCVGRGDARSRVRDAVTNLRALRLDEFPGELRTGFETIFRESRRFDPDTFRPDDGPIEATMRCIPIITTGWIDEQIYQLELSIQQILDGDL
jgi:hypothetical protein